ncbi:MAG: hypothetical protein IZT56_12660 [Bacteroidetes bacterium]|nr:hypothetical protein [Bacteroidota bacterium]
MKQINILAEIEKILKDNLSFNGSDDNSDTEIDSETNGEKSTKVGPIRAIINLLISFFVSVIKAPFELIHMYIKREIFAIIRKELRLYSFVIILLGILFTIFIVLWLLISLAIGVYFEEEGASFLTSVLYVIAFQLASFAIIAFITYKVSKKIKSLKLLRDPLN